MSLITVSYNFTSHDDAIAFMQHNGPAGLQAVSEAPAAPAPTPAATKPKATKTVKSFGPTVEGDAEGTRYFHNPASGALTKAPKGNTGIESIAGNVEISGADYLQKKAELASKAVTQQTAAAAAPSQEPASESGAADLMAGASDEFDPFAEPAAAPTRTDVPEPEVMAKLQALTKVENGRTKLIQILKAHGDGVSVPLMLKGATGAKRVAIFEMAESLLK